MQTLKASRLSLALVTRQHSLMQRRTFLTPTASLRADLIQDLYLREIKGYKPSPLKPSDADAHVQKFAVPKPPPSPEESDIAKDLQTYEQQTVEVEGQAPDGQPVVEEDWFEADLEEEEEEEEAKAQH